MNFSALKILSAVFISLLSLASYGQAQQSYALKFTGAYPANLKALLNGTEVDSPTEVIAHGNYVAQSPLCKGGADRGNKSVKLPVAINTTQNRYAFLATRHLGPPCGYVLVSLSFGLALKGTDNLLGGVLVAKGPANPPREHQLPKSGNSFCTLDKYGTSNVVICQPVDSAALSFYLPEDWSQQDFQYNFVIKP